MAGYNRQPSAAGGYNAYAKDEASQNNPRTWDVTEVQRWFTEHVTLFDAAYTLDADQARAVCDLHKNTLVVARAGSGKTRVIVAKVAFLVTQCGLNLSEIAIFMFNRTAAAEVNTRIAAVKIDGQPLTTSEPHVASTFHKFALDTTKSFGQRPQIITEAERAAIILSALNSSLEKLRYKPSPSEKRELLGLVSNFINRAGQKFPGVAGLKQLASVTEVYITQNSANPDYEKRIFWHRIALFCYREYFKALAVPRTDFNLLMSTATELMNSATKPSPALCNLRYIMVDEYQDFSYLFYALVLALRRLSPSATLFAVGDDWQAINRFAGSDVKYFTDFAHFFPEDATIIPLATNYRSAKRIVLRANQFMLTHYDPKAIPARAFNRDSGKIKFLNPSKQHFDASDIREDGLGDGRYQLALAEILQVNPRKVPSGAAKLLKQLVRIIRHHVRSEIMLLHRHNFTSFEGITLEVVASALQLLLARESIMSPAQYARQIRCMTMHKSKGLEAEVVILLEVDRKIVAASHPHATIFELFDDTRAAEIADQQRLLYVAMTRAKRQLYVLSSERTPLI